MLDRQPATDGPPTRRERGSYEPVYGTAAWPSGRSRSISAAWLVVLVVALGVFAALVVAVSVLVAWAFLSSALT